jgi:biotin-dependent carboxylase-like uncharacterized protein
MGLIKVNNPGLLTTVQDMGRYGYQKFGMPAAGAADPFAYRVANLLVGNTGNSSVLEMTYIGPELHFITEAVIAITGANMNPALDGVPIPMWETVTVPQNSILKFERALQGFRSYLAVRGGIDVPLVMGSRSTYLRGEIGGYKGRKLQKGDEIKFFDMGDKFKSFIKKRLPKALIPDYKPFRELRVVLGPQDDHFLEESINTFFSATYTLTGEIDRMGCRLEGPPLKHKKGADIISDGIPLGGIQVPGHGKPIIMLCDRQTTGGYAKIATVISADIPFAAQLKPGDEVKFKEVSLQEAYRIIEEQEKAIKSIETVRAESRYFKVRVNNRDYFVEFEELK